ncbi:hypothetical protein NQ315_002701 [Exocentrus adspersus]|uniref:Uncharacterized protein n=1 Tax=Exocentrus adspersus TaxID=1586481 RepID=A0AAV8VI77_9CUCU|nr:hypothetical protein NQ315_002701 [Exocentrus adspersus]
MLCAVRGRRCSVYTQYIIIMLPIQIYNQLILREEERRQTMAEINRERKLLRNESDPFLCPTANL